MISIGLDISTYVGIAKVAENEFVGKALYFKEQTGLRRAELLAQEVSRVLTNWHPDVVVIEAYAYGNHNSLVTLVEIGTIVRYHLYKIGINWWEVPPTVLKKATCGRGNASKDDMACSVKKLWGYSSPSDDVIDAFALAKMGLLISDGIEFKGVYRGY